MRITKAIQLAAENAGIKRVYFGDIEETVTTINSEDKVNVENMPALFCPMGFRSDFEDFEITAKLNILIAVNSSDVIRADERIAKNFDEVLPELVYKFLRQLASLQGISVIPKSEWMRPKVNEAFGAMVKNSKIFNKALDGWELQIELKTTFKEC